MLIANAAAEALKKHAEPKPPMNRAPEFVPLPRAEPKSPVLAVHLNVGGLGDGCRRPPPAHSRPTAPSGVPHPSEPNHLIREWNELWRPGPVAALQTSPPNSDNRDHAARRARRRNRAQRSRAARRVHTVGGMADPFPRTLMPPVRLPATVDPGALLVVGYLRAAEALLLGMHGTGRMEPELVASTLGALRVAIYAAEEAARLAPTPGSGRRRPPRVGGGRPSGVGWASGGSGRRSGGAGTPAA